MRLIRGSFILVVAWFATAGPVGAGVQAPPSSSSFVQLFEYDSSASLDTKETSVRNFGGVLVHDITYASPKGGRVPAYLVVPPDRGPFAGIIFHHWGLGDRSEFLPEAVMLARAGAVSILIDAPFIRPAPWTRSGDFTHAEAERDASIQDVIDLRRAIDLLLARSDVDPKRIGYVGHSVGACLGGVLAGVEKRVKAYVLMAGNASSSRNVFTSPNPQVAEAVASTPKQVLDRWMRIQAPLDAEHYVRQAAPAALLFQIARFDLYVTEEEGLDYYRKASQPKTALWYSTGHELNDLGALRDRDEWLAEQLGLAPVGPLLHDQLETAGPLRWRILP
jgi:dienelactone hydrolase